MNQMISIENNQNYGLVTSSRDIAFGLRKRHDHVIRDLENILENTENPNLSSLIIQHEYEVIGQSRKYKEYLLTKDGFTLYMFNIQGYNDFKLAYIQKFNEMEQIAKTLPDRTMKDLEEKIKRLELNMNRNLTSDYTTIIGYAILKEIKLLKSESAKMGKIATGICRNEDIPIGKVPDPKYGVINTYPTHVLDRIFSNKEKSHSEEQNGRFNIN